MIPTSPAPLRSIFQLHYQTDSCKMPIWSCHSASPCTEDQVNSPDMFTRSFAWYQPLLSPRPDLHWLLSLCYFLLFLQISVYVSLFLRCFLSWFLNHILHFHIPPPAPRSKTEPGPSGHLVKSVNWMTINTFIPLTVTQHWYCGRFSMWF